MTIEQEKWQEMVTELIEAQKPTNPEVKLQTKRLENTIAGTVLGTVAGAAIGAGLFYPGLKNKKISRREFLTYLGFSSACGALGGGVNSYEQTHYNSEEKK